MIKKTKTLVIMRPIFFTVLMGIGILVISNLAIGYWYQKTNHMTNMMETSTNSLHSCLASQVEQTAKLANRFKLPATNLARLMRNSLNATSFSQADLHAKVAPLLYQEFAMLPYISQIGYIGLGGLFFSYCYESNQSYAMYYRDMTFYKQPSDLDTGKLNGKATKSSIPIGTIRRSVREALSSNNKQHNLVSKGWNGNAQELMFINLAGVQEKGAVLLGISAEIIRRFFISIDFQRARLHVTTRDGNQVVFDGIPEIQIMEIDRHSISIVTDAGGDVTCFLGNGTTVVNIAQQEYKVHCSSIELIGVEMVYALAFPNDEPEGSDAIHKSRKLAFILLMTMIVVLVISIFGFLLLTAKAAQRVTQLRSALIKQMEATQQAERKSLKKSLGFASASHEIRNLLTPISGFIEDCFLSAILDTSKLEEGKMQLEDQEFNVVDVLEDVVDLFHPMAMRKDVDLILDLSHVSILKFGQVIGDKGKLKQVLWNLVSNAVKYTDEGQIVVRARVQQPDFESVIASSHHDGCSEWMSKLVKWNSYGEDNEAEQILSAVEHNPNRMEFVFEVDDSGKGIPKDKQKSVFENYVQVKENSEGQVGTGLGLGIVQSLMSNEITQDGNRSFNCARLFLHTPRRVGSHVVLLINNEARRRASQKLIENLGLKVTVVEQWEHLENVLSKMKPNLNHSSRLSSLRKSDAGSRSWNSSDGSKDMIPLSLVGGFLLLVVDASAGPFKELHRVVIDFRTGVHVSGLKVVWMDRPTSRRVEGGIIDPSDEVMLKPFHGVGLIEVIKLLPEYDVTATPSRKRIKEWGSSSSSSVRHRIRRAESSPQFIGDFKMENKMEKEEEHHQDDVVTSSIENKPLDGVTFLVVDDSKPVRFVSKMILSKLGAKFEECEDGLQALRRFQDALQEQVRNGVSPHVPPYDFILMDGQMPKMDGYEATMAIREEEKSYAIHTPIIGLTGNTSKEELERIVQVGMDVHLAKPFKREDILEAIQRIRGGV
ncbi:Histidine kinase CKI1 [Linum grandiflorum]